MFLCVRAYRMIFTSSLSLYPEKTVQKYSTNSLHLDSPLLHLCTTLLLTIRIKQIALTDGWYDAGAAVDTTELN